MAYDTELAERVRALLVYEPDVVEKKMFGGLSFLIGGHLAVGVSGSGGLLCGPSRVKRRSCSRSPTSSPS